METHNGKLLTNGLVISMDDERHVWDPGFVAIVGDRIESVGPMSECDVSGALNVEDVGGDIVMPGLVNCHGHLQEGIHRGFYDEAPLAEWMDGGFWPTVRVMTEELAYASARLTIAELLLSGVTTTETAECSQPDHNAIDGALRAASESGIRAVVSRMAIDSPDPSIPGQFVPEDLRDTVPVAVAEVQRLRKRWNSSLIQVVPEALGVLRCTPEMVQALSRLAMAENISMFMHVASSRSEVEGCSNRYGRRPIEQLGYLNVLGPHLLIAHCVWPSEQEIDLLAKSGTRVSHNPVANLHYAEGIAPLKELLEAGVAVGLGTDGASTNNSLNLWETMKFAMLLQKHRLEDALYGSGEKAIELATIGGASAMAMRDAIGSLQAGRKADLIVVARRRLNLVPKATVAANLVYAGSPSAVRVVIVDGEVLVHDGALTRWTIDDIVNAAELAANEVIDRANLRPMLDRKKQWTWESEKKSVSASEKGE